MDKKRIAFFDFDKTLVRRDSLFLFARFTHGRIGFYKRLIRQLLKGCTSLFSSAKRGEIKIRLLSDLYKGWDTNLFKARCREFADILDSNLQDNVVALMRAHQQRGDIIVIVSASLGSWIRPWAERHNVKMVLATEMELDSDSGKITGRLHTQNCKGQEKAERIRKEFPDLDHYESWGYADSRSDKYMLALTDHPHMIRSLSSEPCPLTFG